MKQNLGTYAPPKNYGQLSVKEKRAWAKDVADKMRKRAGLPPTDARGHAPTR